MVSLAPISLLEEMAQQCHQINCGPQCPHQVCCQQKSPWQSCYWLCTLSSRPQSCCSSSVNIAFHSLCARYACCSSDQPASLPCEALGLTWAQPLSKPARTACEIANHKKCCYEGNTIRYKDSYRQGPCFLWEMSVWVCVLGTWTNNGLGTQKMGQNCKIE